MDVILTKWVSMFNKIYSFEIRRPDGLRKTISCNSLSEAVRSRHAYKKSPHFKGAWISLITTQIESMKNKPQLPSLGDMAIFKKR